MTTTVTTLGRCRARLVSGRQLRELVADDLWLDELIDRADEGGVALTGPGGSLPENDQGRVERGLAAELTDHLGYEPGDPSWVGLAEQPQRLDPPRRCRPRSARCRWMPAGP